MTDSDKHIWSILLAAGASVRLGNKALTNWGDGTLLSRAVTTARSVCGPRVMVVTGAHHDRIVPLLQSALTVFNRDWPLGMGASIRAGAEAVLAEDRGASMMLIMPVDQPFILPDYLRMLARHASQRDCCMLSGNGNLAGPPAAIPSRFFGKLLTLSGPSGLRSTLGPNEYGTLNTLDHAEGIDGLENLGQLTRFARGPDGDEFHPPA